MAKADLPKYSFLDPHDDRDDYQDSLLGYATAALQEGDAFIRAQNGYGKISQSIDLIMGKHINLLSTNTLSQTSSNRFGKIAADLAALLTDVRPFWDFRTAPNSRFEKTATNLSKLSQHWYTMRRIDMRFADCLKYYIVAGTGYMYQYWDPSVKDMMASAEDPRDVIPIRPAGYESLQDAVGVILRRERTTNYIRQHYGVEVPSDRDGSALSQTGNTRTGRLLAAIGSPFWEQMSQNTKAKRTIPKVPTTDLYIMYLHDDRVNEKPYPVQIGQFDRDGEPLNNWSYIVEPGQPLYPRGRCIEFTKSRVLYDGPNIYWHGLFPICKLTLDAWPWSWLGKAPIWDLIPLQQSLDKLLRIVDDASAKIGQPDLIADKNSMSQGALNKIDTRRAGLKIRTNMLAGKGVQIEKSAPIDQTIVNQIQWLKDEMREISGVSDLSQLMRLNQIPSDDTISKIMESMSPSVRARSRAIEAFMREFATITAYNFMQFYTLPQKLAILGPQSVTPEDFDYDPGSMIPDYVHDEDLDKHGMPTSEALMRGPRPRYDRARVYMTQFFLNVAPASILTASEIERQMKYLQLSRAGLIDHWTLLETLGIPNVGSPPANANTITQRLQAEQALGIGMNVSPAGRKASGSAPPRMVIKESK